MPTVTSDTVSWGTPTNETTSQMSHVLDSLKTDGWYKLFPTGVAGSLTWLVGDNIPIIVALAIFFVIDFTTGAHRAILTGEFGSRGLRQGAMKLLVYSTLIVLGHQATQVSSVLSWFDDAIFSYLVITEYESITENLQYFGVELPSLRKLRGFLTNKQISPKKKVKK